MDFPARVFVFFPDDESDPVLIAKEGVFDPPQAGRIVLYERSDADT